MVERLKSLLRGAQVAVVLAVLAIGCCCAVVGLALALPSADAPPTPVAISGPLWALLQNGSVKA
jgi:hypothetical protein